MKKKMMMIALITALAVTAFSLSLKADPAQNESPRRHFLKKGTAVRHAIIEALWRLNLNDSQKKQIRAIIKDAIQENKGLLSEFTHARRELAQTMLAENTDENAIREAFGKLAPYREDILVLRAKTLAKIKPLLSQSQKNILQQLKEDLEKLFTSGFSDSDFGA